MNGTGDLGLDAYLERVECDATDKWFASECREPVRICPAAHGEWYINAQGSTRCKLCDRSLYTEQKP